jgi:S1-C subfamily serine protease
MTENSIPISTRWLLDSVGETGRSVIKAIYMLVSTKTKQKGTAFLLRTGFMLSNWHVVEGSLVGELLAISSEGEQIEFKNMVNDQNRDLVVLEPRRTLTGGLLIKKEGNIKVGTQVATWGYPLGYNGPAPLLTIGYLSGFNDSPPYEETASIVKHLVVNSAFNPGNSGGPLFIAQSQEVIGVVVSKHAPITTTVRSAIEALANSKSGFMYNATDEHGNPLQFSEAQVVAEVLKYFRQMTQVMIGEAIASSEVIAFLEHNNLKY